MASSESAISKLLHSLLHFGTIAYMELNNANQPVNVGEVSTAPVQHPVNNQRYNLLILLSVFVLLLLVGGGAYYLGIQKNQSAITNNNQLVTTPSYTPTPTVSTAAGTRWEEYISSFGYSFKYPQEMTISKNTIAYDVQLEDSEYTIVFKVVITNNPLSAVNTIFKFKEGTSTAIPNITVAGKQAYRIEGKALMDTKYTSHIVESIALDNKNQLQIIATAKDESLSLKALGESLDEIVSTLQFSK